MLRLRLFYYNNNSKVILNTFGDGTNVTEALHEAMKWCEENCEERGIMTYYYNGNRIHAEQCK